MATVSSTKLLRTGHPLIAGAAAGLVAGLVAGLTNRLLDRLISAEQKRRDRQVREAPAHELAGPYFAGKMLRRKLTEQGKKRAQVAFSAAYGLGWGMIYAAARKKFPQLSRWGGIPFAIPFFFACDGIIAPSIGISPSLRRIPWQPSAKELGNHIAWTAAAEMVQRAVAKAAR